jgi:hypothetical protein
LLIEIRHRCRGKVRKNVPGEPAASTIRAVATGLRQEVPELEPCRPAPITT